MNVTDTTAKTTRAIVRVLEQLAERIVRDMRDVVSSLNIDEGKIEGGRFNLAQVANARRRVREAAKKHGVPSVLKALRKDLPRLLREVVDELDLGDFRPEIERDLERVLRGQEREIARAIVDGTSDEVASAIRQAVTGAGRTTVAKATAAVARAVDTSLGRAAVAVERGVREFRETAVIETGARASRALDDDVIVYEYVGPDDGVTRPYCQARVGRYLTIDQARDLAPRERFNCRHSPAPVRLSEARGQGLSAFRGR